MSTKYLFLTLKKKLKKKKERQKLILVNYATRNNFFQKTLSLKLETHFNGRKF